MSDQTLCVLCGRKPKYYVKTPSGKRYCDPHCRDLPVPPKTQEAP